MLDVARQIAPAIVSSPEIGSVKKKAKIVATLALIFVSCHFRSKVLAGEISWLPKAALANPKKASPNCSREGRCCLPMCL